MKSGESGKEDGEEDDDNSSSIESLHSENEEEITEYA